MSSPSKNFPQRILREIHRRSLWKVLGIYAVGSWGAFEVVLTPVPPDDPRHGRMIVEVRSLDAAARALDSLAIGHRRVGAEVHVDPERMHGLTLVLCER